MHALVRHAYRDLKLRILGRLHASSLVFHNLIFTFTENTNQHTEGPFYYSQPPTPGAECTSLILANPMVKFCAFPVLFFRPSFPMAMILRGGMREGSVVPAIWGSLILALVWNRLGLAAA